jgi:hypothetical protein
LQVIAVRVRVVKLSGRLVRAGEWKGYPHNACLTACDGLYNQGLVLQVRALLYHSVC